jgi:hypothetical protein
MTPTDDDPVVAQLRASLDRAASAAPDALDGPFREAAPTRRRRRVARILAGAIAVAALIPIALVVVRGENANTTVTTSLKHGSTAAEPGWRWEMWSNVQIQVPDSWARDQDITQWCLIRDQAKGFVSRPQTIHTQVGCIGPDDYQAPTQGPLLAFLDPSENPELGTRTYPNGTVTIERVGQVTVMVVAKDDKLRQRILDSAEIVGEVNGAGCPTATAVPLIGDASSTGPAVANLDHVDTVSVCRYYDNDNAYAYTLTGAKAAGLLSALRKAPTGRGPDRPAECAPGVPEREAGLYRLWSDNVATDVWVHWDNCRGHGIDDGVTQRVLTAGTLSPLLGVAWSGQIPNGVVFTPYTP